GRELLLQALEGGEVLPEAEALEGQGPQPELALRLEELRAAVDVDAVAVGEVEPQAVELTAWHRDAQARAVGRALAREQHARPARLSAELRDPAPDPDRGQAAEPARPA